MIAYKSSVSVRDLLALEQAPVAAGERYLLTDVKLLAPCMSRVVFGVGLNYPLHVAEGGASLPEEPQLFMKGPASVMPPGGPVVRPLSVTQLDYEGELALVIGWDGKVGGYAIANDVSARDFLHDEQLTRHKAGDTFCPWGPWITTRDDVADAYALRLRTWVDGELRQDASTSEMVFREADILTAIGKTIKLEAGDLVLTGTPAGVGLLCDPPKLLEPGQRVRIEIDELGAIEHVIDDSRATFDA